MTQANKDQAVSGPQDASGARCADLVRSASIEATPRQILTTEHLPDLLPAGTSVYVPFLPKGDFLDTLEASRRLLDLGMQPVPHVPARMAQSLGQLRDWLAQLEDSRVDRFLLIAGDSDSVAGPFPDTLAVLDSGVLSEFRFHGLGVAAHPDGHPMADRATLARALSIKREYARAIGAKLWAVTQFTFDADVVADWLNELGSIFEDVPVYIGMAGPTRIKTLIAYAAMCGVGASARMLLRRPGSARMLGAWKPDDLVRSLARYSLEHPDTLLPGIHLYPFGGLRQSAQWIREHSGPLEQVREATS